MTPPGRRKRGSFLLLVVAFALLCNAAATVLGHEASYIGCFGDSAASNQKRALPYGFVMDHSMTHEMCFSICGDRGLEYAGMEYGQECWCSASPVTNYPRIADDRCDMPCEGNTKQKCGGPNALTVFHIKTAAVSEEHKKRMEGRPLLALVMILKNEAHTLKNTFTTVQDFINVWYILDTGSTDGTQDLIEKELAKIPGKLYEEPFVDYGFTRNRILDIANQSDPRPIFTIMLSADEQVVNMGELIPFLKSHIYAFGPQHDAYPVVMNTGILFDSLRIARVDGNWRYQGRVHEYLAAPGGRWVDVCRPVPDIRVNFQATDNDRRFKSQWFIASILEDEISKKPNDTRSLYYLARTYQTISNFTASFNIYKRLASVSSWDEERYESLFNLGLLCQQMNWDWSRCHQLFLDAHEHKPSKVDVLYHLALYYHGKGKQYYPIAYIYAKEAMSKTIPENIQTVQNVLMRESISTYQYRAAQLTAQLASAIGEHQTCIDACNKWLDFNPQELMAQTIRENCIREMPKITTTTPPPVIKKKRAPTAAPSTPTPTWRIKRLYDQYMHPSNAVDPHLVTDQDGYVETANPFHRLSPVSAIILGVSILLLVAILMYVNRRRKKFKGK